SRNAWRMGLMPAMLLSASLSAQQPAPPPTNETKSDAWRAKEEKFLTNVRQLTSPTMGLQKSGEAYFAPDAKSIIFQAIPPGDEYYQIYTLQLDDQGRAKPETLMRISTGAGACTCSFFRPDGKKIIFASSHLDPRLETNPRPEEKAGY